MYSKHVSLDKCKNIYLDHNLDTLLSLCYEVLVPGQVNRNFLLDLREMRQVGEVGYGISPFLYSSIQCQEVLTSPE